MWQNPTNHLLIVEAWLSKPPKMILKMIGNANWNTV